VEIAPPLPLSTPVGTAAGGGVFLVKVKPPPVVAAGGAAIGRPGLSHFFCTFAGSITEAVWPLGCSIRRNVSPVLSWTS
jgi:hypothetical protein